MTLSVVILSGALNRNSATERIALWCAERCRPHATVRVFRGADLRFPFYAPGLADLPDVREFLTAVAGADAVLLVSPTYHGSVSGLLKNAVDFLNDLADDPRPFLDERSLGCVAVAGGEQGAAGTLHALRTIGHALRAWPTPLGVGVAGPSVTTNGQITDARTTAQLRAMLEQMLGMAARLHVGDRIPAGAE